MSLPRTNRRPDVQHKLSRLCVTQDLQRYVDTSKTENISDTKLLHLPFGPRLSVGFKNYFWASSTVNDMFTHFEQLRYLDFYALIKLSVVLPHGVCKIPRKF
jgi:hypothetical protein